MFLALGLPLLAAVFTSLTLDEEKVTQKIYNTSQTLYWKDVVSMEQPMNLKNYLTLKSAEGKAICIFTGAYSLKIRTDIINQINGHLPEVRSMQARNIEGNTVRPYHKLSNLLIVFSIFTFFMEIGITVVLLSGHAPLNTAMPLFFIFGIPGLLIMCSGLFQRSIVLILKSDSLTRRTLLNSTKIDFKDVQSIFTQHIERGANSFQLTTIKDLENHKIDINSNAAFYVEMMHYLKDQISQHASENGFSERVGTGWQDTKQRIAILTVIGSLLVVFGAYALYDSNNTLAQYHLLNTIGRNCIGKVTDLIYETQSHGGQQDYMYYSYRVNGVKHNAKNLINSYTYNNSDIGQTVHVIYNPSNPIYSTVPGSLEEVNAQSGIYFAIGMIVVGICLPTAFYFQFYWRNRQQRVKLL